MMGKRFELQVGEGACVAAEWLDEGRARLVGIPRVAGLALNDVVRVGTAAGGAGHALLGVAEGSGYRGYGAWALIHRPAEVGAWQQALAQSGIVVEWDEPPGAAVPTVALALPPALSALGALALLNRHAPRVELICPLLAAHADDWERAKSDLERAVAWGAAEPELCYALADAFEQQGHWDEAVTFWERLAHLLPTTVAARERLAVAYARLGVFPHAAAEFDRAADLAEGAAHRARLWAARDLMWQRSRL